MESQFIRKICTTKTQGYDLKLMLNRLLCLFLIGTHIVYIGRPSLTFAAENTVKSPEMAAVNNGQRGYPTVKGEFEPPDHIPASRGTLFEVEVEAPQTADLPIHADSFPGFSEVQQRAALDMVSEHTQTSWEAYLAWFGGATPKTLRFQLEQENGRNLHVDSTASRLIIEGYGAKGDLLGQVSFRLAPDMAVGNGGDTMGRDYQNFQGLLRSADEFISRWMARLGDPITFDPSLWVRFEYDQSHLIALVPGPYSRALYAEVGQRIMSAFAQLESAGPGMSEQGLWQAFKVLGSVAPPDSVDCVLSAGRAFILFGLVFPALVWVVQEIILAILQVYEIYPIVMLFAKMAESIKVTYASAMSVSTFATIVQLYMEFGGASQSMAERMARRGINRQMRDAFLRSFMQINEYEIKASLRKGRVMAYLNSPTVRALVGFVGLLTSLLASYDAWKECKNREEFPMRMRAYAGVIFELGVEQGRTEEVTEIVGAANAPQLSTLNFTEPEQIEPYMLRDPLAGNAFIGMGATLLLGMGNYHDIYANTIDSPRDLALDRGTASATFLGFDSYGVTTDFGSMTLALNMPSIIYRMRSDVDPLGHWYVWQRMGDEPSMLAGCDATWRPGRERGWCQLSIVPERDWETSASDPGPSVNLRIEFPTARM